LNGRRIQMINVSSAMGGQFAYLVSEMTSDVIELGPNPLGNNK
jgi:coenzyme F420-reducing hydrogenase delta subunit